MRREFAALWTRGGLLRHARDTRAGAAHRRYHRQLGGQDEDVRLAATRLVRGINVLGLAGAQSCLAA